MKKFQRLTALLLALCLLAAMPTTALALNPPPRDVPPPNGDGLIPESWRSLGAPTWYSDAVYDLWYIGVVRGTGETGKADAFGELPLFRPNQVVTREQFIVMLFNLARYHYGDDRFFNDPAFWGGSPLVFVDWLWTDVSNFAWNAMDWAVRSGILVGDGRAVRGTSPITRQEAAALLRRYTRVVGGSVFETPEQINLLKIYQDGGKVSAWALEDMRWAVWEQFVAGTATSLQIWEPGTDGKPLPTLNPQGLVTRAEAAQMLDSLAINLYWYVTNPSGDPHVWTKIFDPSEDRIP